jgi:hypothetical protein
MTSDEGARQAATLYLKYRVAGQRTYYENRRAEYEDASGQLSGVTTVLLMLAAAAGALGAAEVGIGRAGWGIIGAACSASVAVMAGWGTLIGFQENAKLFRGGSAALRRIAGPLADWPGDRDVLLGAVVRAEEVLQSETGQWGQQLTGSAAQLAHEVQAPARLDASARRPAQRPVEMPSEPEA